MPICVNGHDSATADYCDDCGAKITGAGTSIGAQPSGVGQDPAAGGESPLCPLCGAPKAGRFCERDGHDFFTASLEGGSGAPGAALSQAEASVASPGVASPGAVAIGVADETGADPAAGGAAVVVVADRAHYDRVVATDGPDADGIRFPAYCPQRQFELRGDQMVIGRFSRSRGITPDIDLVGPPEDPGVSHLHAMLVSQPEGGWAVVDLRSANGTYVNGAHDPIPSETPVPLRDGDHFHVGAWTKLILREKP